MTYYTLYVAPVINSCGERVENERHGDIKKKNGSSSPRRLPLQRWRPNRLDLRELARTHAPRTACGDHPLAFNASSWRPLHSLYINGVWKRKSDMGWLV